MEKDPKDGALVEAHMFELSQLATLMSGKESKKTAAAMRANLMSLTRLLNESRLCSTGWG